MFEAELKRAETTFGFVEEDNLDSLQAQWTLLDPSRVLQVLINSMINATKSTLSNCLGKNSQTFHAASGQGAPSRKPTDSNAFGVRYVQKRGSNLDQTAKAQWGDGEVISLCITVLDAGRG
ncbi:hypothetical protein B2J93_5060 [Marssonina coronariae]|uniref:Uncharacterized protein n=1 Tax=Diplocarpon coronariae TaxID=2795749 RepID=A0A218ZER1_9HELO|nr:hypothetical protein B2J93_5060 [Marssonina coronariae]